MKRGFTLIELLVAVLIIGVLTAMALPMYQKSVDKSRYATLMPLAKNIKDAQEAFYLGGGKYSKDLGSLDVRVPGNPSGNTATLSDGTTVEISNTDGTGYVKMGKENLNNYYVMYQDRSSNYPGEIHCEALSDNDRANELCQNLGGTKIDNALTSGYTAYVLVGTGENAGSGGTLPVTKQVVSTEACTQFASYSNCTKYVYDDGTYAEHFSRDGEPAYSVVYDASGRKLATSSRWEDGSGSTDLSGEAGNSLESFYIRSDGTVSFLSSQDTVESLGGEVFNGYRIDMPPDFGWTSISYGDVMSGSGESYEIYPEDGSWHFAQARNDEAGYDMNYHGADGSVDGYREAEAAAITNTWAASGYHTDYSYIQDWIERKKNDILTSYCALDPINSICQ